MKEGDGETWYAYYALNKFHWEPSKFVNLPFKEKALVIAMIDERIEEEKKQNNRAKASGRRRGR